MLGQRLRGCVFNGCVLPELQRIVAFEKHLCDLFGQYVFFAYRDLLVGFGWLAVIFGVGLFLGSCQTLPRLLDRLFNFATKANAFLVLGQRLRCSIAQAR